MSGEAKSENTTFGVHERNKNYLKLKKSNFLFLLCFKIATKLFYYAPKGTLSSILKSHRLSNCPSVTNCVSHNSKTDIGNLIKLHRKIKQNEKVCHAQNLGSHDLGQGHNRRSKVCHLQIVCQP